MSSLIVLLPHGAASPAGEWAYALSPDGQRLESHGSAPLALLPAPRGAGAEVVAVAPVRTLSWHRVALPQGITAASPRLRGVLEGLLEEQLLDDPDSLHFAIQPEAASSGAAWVASCSREWLRQTLQSLEEAGRPVGRVVPEAAPQDEPQLYAMGEPEAAQWVLAGPQGVLAMPLSAASLALVPPQAREACQAEPAVAALAEQALGHKVSLQQAPQRWVDATRSHWDLAQFEFSRSARARTLKKLASTWADLWRAPHWRAARWGALALVALQVLGLNAWAWKERSALDLKRQAVRETLTRTFPNVKTVVDAPVQMEREVAALRQLTGVSTGRDLESMLGALSQSAPPGRFVASIDYNGAQLRAKGLNLSSEEARIVGLNLKSLGYAATLEGDTLVLQPEGAP